MSDLAIHTNYEKDIEELISEEQAVRELDYEDEDLMQDVVEEEEDEENDELEQFVPLLKSMKLDRLPDFAVSIRTQKTQSKMHQSLANTDAGLLPLTCKILHPLSGSYNILFQLEFSDGVRWLFKVPVTGYHGRFDELAAQALKCEAMTMRLLKRETTIPIPQVYSFDASLDNDVNCPFIMMEYIQGRPLHELWFQPSSCDATIQQVRERILKNLAAAMAQLNNLTFRQGGSLRFDSEGRIVGVGSSKVPDLGALYDKMNSGDCDSSPVFCAKGPFNDITSFLKFNLDRRGPIKANPARFHRGIHMLLRQFIDWIPTDQSTEEPQFILTHPDYALQNILVSEDGTLQGVIDWDGVAAIPRCMGQYPLWLMRDWDPASYNYNPISGKLCDPDGQWENTPKELELYRKLYARSMEQCISKQRGQDGIDCGDAGLGAPVLSQRTDLAVRKSILAWSLAVAADDSMSTTASVSLVFKEIDRLTTPDQESASSTTDSDTSNGKESKSDGNTDCTSRSSAGTGKPAFHESLTAADAPGEINTARKQIEGLDAVEGTTSKGPNGPRGKWKPLCNRIQEALRYNGKSLHKKNLKKAPKDLKPLPAIIHKALAEACPNENAKPRGRRIQSALDYTVGLLRRKTPKGSSNCTEVKSANSQVYTYDNVKLCGGGFRNPLHRVMGFLKNRKAEKPHKDAVTQSNLFPSHKTTGFSRNQKSKNSLGISMPLSAVVDASTSQEVKPHYVDAQSTDQPIAQSLPDCKMEGAEGQRSLNPAMVEVRTIYHQAILKLENGGIFGTMSKEHRALVEDVIEQVAETLRRGLPCNSDAKLAPEVLLSAEVIEAKDVPLTPVTTEKEVSESPEVSEAKDVAPTIVKTENNEYDPSLFALWSVAHGIADGELSDEFWQRLERGFDALVDSL